MPSKKVDSENVAKPPEGVKRPQRKVASAYRTPTAGLSVKPTRNLAKKPTKVPTKTSTTAKKPTKAPFKAPTKNLAKTPAKGLTKASTKAKKSMKVVVKAPAKGLAKAQTKGPAKTSTKAKKPMKILVKAPKSTAKPPTKTTKSKEIPKKKSGLPPEEAIESALLRLHSSSVPDTVPCRERHFEEIFGFVEDNLMAGDGGCMYVSGVPGTGKTTTLNEVHRRLERCSYLPPFDFLGINAVQLGDPKKFYSHFCSLLTLEEMSNKKAFQYLNNRFTDGDENKDYVILFVDEFDYLRTKSQDILYMLFDWPKQRHSRLIIIAIANTMDLPENTMLKLTSRIAFHRVAFHPYNYEELETILLSRIGDLVNDNIFQMDALRLICRKVAGSSGDARRVLDIGRRAVENAIRAKRTTVEITDVTDAFQEILNSTKVIAVRDCSEQEKIFLQALVQDSLANGDQESRFIDVYKIHVEICRLEGTFIPTTTELSQIAIRLDQSKMIILEKSNSHLYRKILLNISVEDVQLALGLDCDD